MAIVIHTIKGHQYAYEHHRVGDKIISDYIGSVGDQGQIIKPWGVNNQRVTQQNNTDKINDTLSTEEKIKAANKLYGESENYIYEYGAEINDKIIFKSKDQSKVHDYIEDDKQQKHMEWTFKMHKAQASLTEHKITKEQFRKIADEPKAFEDKYEVVHTKKEMKLEIKQQVKKLLGKSIVK